MPDTSARHLNDRTQTRFIIVRETREISRGRSQSGREYAMWQLIATKPDGTPIEANLRSFEDMPRGEVLEVAVTPFVSEQWGTSYTVARKNKSQLHSDLESLERRVAAIEVKLGIDPGTSGLIPGQGPPPPPPVTETGPAPPPPPLGDASPGSGNGDFTF